MDLSGIPQPQIDWEVKNLPEAWRRFKQHVDLIFKGPLKSKTEDVKCTYLLLWVGEKGRDIRNTWTDISDEECNTLEVYYSKYQSYVQPKLNPIFARYKFNNEVQGISSIEQFVTRLKLLANDCDFPDRDGMLRDRIVFGTSSSKVREKLINEGGKLTLDKALQIAQSFEYAQEQLKSMNSEIKMTSEVSSLSRSKTYDKPLRSARENPQPRGRTRTRQATYGDRKSQTYGDRKSQGRQRKCTRCGREHYDNATCPAKGRQCDKCQKWNHFASVCKTNTENVNEVIEATCASNTSDTDSDDFYIDSIESNVVHGQAFATLEVGNQDNEVKFKLDTGSQVNILPESLYNKLEHTYPLKSPESQLYAYCGNSLKAIGQCNLNCKYRDHNASVKFYIVSTKSTPILSLQSCIDFGLIELTYSVDAHINNVQPLTKDTVLSQYADTFEGIGLFPGECTIHVDPNAIPVVHPPRKVPIAIRAKVKAELDRMEKSNIIAKVNDPTEWVNSMVVVEKPSTGKLRICLDPVDLNRSIKRPHYPMRTIEDVLPQLTGARYFTKLDARSGYWAIKLTNDSTFLTTFNTPFGRYRYLRLPFGISCAQDEFQRKIDESFEGVDGMEAIVDDILVYGRTVQEHDMNLRAVLQRAQDKGIKLNADKLEVGVSEVRYFGHIISADGLRVDPAKVSAISQMKAPSNRAELETILGMINYLAKFAPNLSELTCPMRQLLSRDIEFVWDHAQNDAFEKVKEVITQSPVLAYFDPNKEVTLQVDASKHGLGAVILQNGKPVAYASKTLTPTEVRYAQIEKEMYAIVFGCTRFHHYIYGRHVTIESDHKPLTSIVRKPLHAAPPRLQRMLMQLQKYDLDVQHRPGTSIPVADTLSRKFLPDTYPHLSDSIDAHVHTVVNAIPVSDRKLQDVRTETNTDAQLIRLVQTIKDGWPNDRQNCPLNILEFWNFRDELSLIDDVIVKSNKIVIPKSMRQDMLNRVHSGHMGIDKCLKRARDCIFWPKMSHDIIQLVQTCTICLERRPSNTKEPLMSREIPDRPWQVTATDLFTWNDQNFVLIVDYYSRYFEVCKLDCNTKSLSVIRKMKTVFARHGIPETVVSDNGPQYSSAEFAKFAKDWDFSHDTSSPHYPQSNGLAEKTVQTIKRIFSKAKASGNDPFIGILEYRTTPLECGLSPSQLLMGRRLRSILPSTHELLKPQTADSQRIHDSFALSHDRQKKYHDISSKPLKPLHTGATVRIRNSAHLWQPAVVTHEHDPRSFTVHTPDGASYRRNRRHLLKTTEDACDVKTPNSTELEPFDFGSAIEPKNDNNHPVHASRPIMIDKTDHIYVTRSGRTVKPKAIYDV